MLECIRHEKNVIHHNNMQRHWLGLDIIFLCWCMLFARRAGCLCQSVVAMRLWRLFPTLLVGVVGIQRTSFLPFSPLLLLTPPLCPSPRSISKRSYNSEIEPRNLQFSRTNSKTSNLRNSQISSTNVSILFHSSKNKAGESYKISEIS